MSFSMTFRCEREGGEPNICQRTDSKLWFGGNRACNNILPLQRLMGRQPKEEERKRKPVNKKWTIDQKWAGLGTIKDGENNHLNVQPDDHFHLKWLQMKIENHDGGFHMWF